MSNYKHLSVSEIQNIDFLYNKMKKSMREIALQLNRSPNTISRTINKYKRKLSWKEQAAVKQGFIKPFKKSYIFDWNHVSRRIAQARMRSKKKHRIVVGNSFYEEMERLLIKGWKPDVISGRLKLEFPSSKEMHISKQTIFNFIYGNPKLCLYQYLSKGRKKPKKQRRTTRQPVIKNKVSLHERPEIVDRRGRIGDFEVDSIIGKRGEDTTIINTTVDRDSRMLFISRVEDKTAKNTFLVMKDKIENEIGIENVKSLTFDNGSEFAYHERFHEMNIATYFADVGAPYQRGTNERTNGMVRTIYPKKTDFSTITEEELRFTQNYFNNLPRKILGYKTPKEVWDAAIKKNK